MSIQSAFAQLEFTMSDTTVTECKGILFDNGGDGVNYLQNSDVSFTICLDGQGTLTLSFEYFCVEQDFDSLTFHAGPDATYPQIGPAWSGTQIPDPISITSGCLTLHFVSDANVACTGWEAQWTTDVIPPVPPQISTILPVPACSSSTAIVNLSKPVHCDSLHAQAFQLLGPLEQGIIQTNPINCFGDSTQQVEITFAQGLLIGGSYTLSLTTNYYDACDSLWTFISEDEFDVFDCPIFVNLSLIEDTICSGNCSQIIAEVTGGNGIYTYSWSNGLPSTGGPQQVCPSSSTIYTLTVDDTSPALPASAQIELTVIPPAVVPAASSHCQSEPPFLLNATPVGGWWIGSGITDSLLGEFTGDSALAGINQIAYVLPYSATSACSTYTQVNVLAIDAGLIQAACPGSPAFPLLGFTPSGGTWSGPNVSSQGIFNPTTEGEFVVTYTVNGCNEDITVYVADIDSNPIPVDTLCQSDASLDLTLSPSGGRWYGEGIVDSLNGIFDPGETNAGLITLSYVLNGCSRDIQVYVKEIWAGWDFTACPSQDAFVIENFSPIGGIWEGQGIADSLTGLFNPNVLSGDGFESDLVYSHPNGCSDTTHVYVFYTNIQNDELVFCSGENGIELNRFTLQTNPWTGVWSGDGVVLGSNPDSSYFNATIAGNGPHYLVFEANTCSDTAVFTVQQSYLEDLPNACELAPLLDLPVPGYASGGVFSGDGLTETNPQQLIASALGGGTHEIYYESPAGCKDTIEIEIRAFEAVSLDGPAGVLCYTDTLYELEIAPSSAVVSGLGYVDFAMFNPIIAGEGEHYVYAETGEGFCLSRDSLLVTVGPSIGHSLFVSRDTLCYGEFSSLLINAFGGSGNLLSYSWNQGLSPLQQQIVSPNQSTMYIVTITDGCAFVRDTADIYVHDEIQYTVSVGEPACYGEEAIAVIEGNNYEILWRNQSYESGDDLPGLSSFTYLAQIVDTSSGCSIDTSITLPGYPLVQAEFLINPNLECIPSDIKEINFIDLSSGAQQGSWNFGDGTVIQYEAGINPFHEYLLHGEYQVILEVSDSNGCAAKEEKELCIQQPYRIYLPSAMTVNGDGINEGFFIQGTGILKSHLWIYNRNNALIFETEELGGVWNATYQGNPVQSGVYGWIAEVQWENKQWYTTAGTITVIK